MGKRHKTTVATIFMKASVETEAFKVNGGPDLTLHKLL